MRGIKRVFSYLMIFLFFMVVNPNTAIADNLKVSFSQIENEFKKYEGWNYVWGGSSPATSFDCSGLVYYVYKSVGYGWSRMTADGQEKFCIPINESEAQAGDLVFFHNGGGPAYHVVIYLGNGRAFHAGSVETGIGYTDVGPGSWAYKSNLTYGRIPNLSIYGRSATAESVINLNSISCLVVGDSISVGLDETDFKSNFKSYDFKGKIGVNAKTIKGYLDEKYSNQDVVVILSGTNGGLKKSDIDEVMATAKNSMVFWVTPYTESPSSSGYSAEAAALLRSYESENNRLHVVPWDERGIGKLAPDKVHPKNYNNVKDSILEVMKKNLRKVDKSTLNTMVKNGIVSEDKLVGMVTISGLATFQQSLSSKFVQEESKWQAEERLNSINILSNAKEVREIRWIEGLRSIFSVLGWVLMFVGILRMVLYWVEVFTGLPAFSVLSGWRLKPRDAGGEDASGKKVSVLWVSVSSVVMFALGIVMVNDVLLNLIIKILVLL